MPSRAPARAALRSAAPSLPGLGRCPRAATLTNRAAGLDSASSTYQAALDQASTTLAALADKLPKPLTQLPAASRELLAGKPAHWGTIEAQKALDAVTQQPMAVLDDIAHQASQLQSQLLAGVPLTWPTLGPAASAAAAGVADLSNSIASVATGLSSSLVSLLAAGSSSGSGTLEPHFGSRLLQQSSDSVTGWLGAQLSQIPHPVLTTDPLNPLGALGELQQLTRLLATLPPGTGSLMAGSEAAQAAVVAILRQQQVQLAETAAALAANPGAALPLQQLSAIASALSEAAAHGFGGHSPLVLALASVATVATVAATAPGAGYSGYTELLYDDGVKLGHDYDGQVVEEYFRRRPLVVAQRAAGVAMEAAGYGLALLLDLWTGKLVENEAERAVQLRGVIERLGPAYVKVAQALSTRVDLLPPQYFLQIQLLQDRVPPFPCEQALEAMAQAFGQPINEVFEVVSERPVAAASLGQVYRARLRPEMGGGEVAVKVLRPGVLEQVALDLYIMREAAAMFDRRRVMNTQWVGVIDEWALRFFAEMDYDKEARNAAQLAQDLSRLSGIVVAKVVAPLSSAEVLTTEWVDGEKLSESRAGDVRELCDTLISAYLIQLLETGFLHADPHPGNLIRTPDGKICILDYGLMTQVTEDQRWALLEYIAHLSTENWEALALDLQVMGFIPPEVNVKDSGLAEPLGVIMAQLVGGGGAAKVNIDKVTDELNQLGKKYPFRIPPFFALILRAFSVIEGIALKVDPDYAIVKECFPYLSRRLLQDDTGRANAILRDLLYGGKQRLDIDRLTRLANGFGAFTTDGLQAQGPGSSPQAAPALAASSAAPAAPNGRSMRGAVEGFAASSTSFPPSPSSSSSSSPAPPTSSTRQADPTLDPVLREALVVLLSKRGSYVQDLLVAEAVAAADALSSSTLNALLQAALSSAPAALARSSVAALGPLRGFVLPVPTPLELLSTLSPALAATPEDKEALRVVQGVLSLLQSSASASAAAAAGRPPAAAASRQARGQQLARAASDLAPLLPELAPGLLYMTEGFSRAFLQRVVQRLGGARPPADAPQLQALGIPALGFMPFASTPRPNSQQRPRK